MPFEQPEAEMQKANVHKVIVEMGLRTELGDRHFEVWNKIDLIGTFRCLQNVLS